MALRAFTFFHLNLAFSSIEESQRALVVERCYWPMLRLAGDHGVPLGIEAPSWTLHRIADIDPRWIDALRDLIDAGLCEPIGAGFVQMIGPLVPAEVNRRNLHHGLDDAERLLGRRPRIALVNEQSYSGGTLPLYAEAGLDAVIVEWENAYSANPDWQSEWRYTPQRAVGADGSSIPVIWNHSIGFQKVQRYAHGDYDLEDVVSYLTRQNGEGVRAVSVYGSDAEVFDFRPGRYKTEADIAAEGEWERIAALFDRLRSDPKIELVLPGTVLDMLDGPGSGQALRLETVDHPTPTKKQEKYNVTRWSVSGRGDRTVNTRCWRLYHAMCERGADAAAWRRLCCLWSSDFRTHITPARWRAFVDDLAAMEADWGLDVPVACPAPIIGGDPVLVPGRMVALEAGPLSARFNRRKGLALDAFTDRTIAETSLFGTLDHGHFESIHMGADFFSGHLVFEQPGGPKITDLSAVDPLMAVGPEGPSVATGVTTDLGRIEKRWTLDANGRALILDMRVTGMASMLGSLRFGFITLNADSFEAADLHVWTHNGGDRLEGFAFKDRAVNHGRPVSALVSANAAFGVTEGVVVIGDRTRCLRIAFDKTDAALIALAHHEVVRGKTFCRLAFSAQELDDTSRVEAGGGDDLAVRFTITAHRTADVV